MVDIKATNLPVFNKYYSIVFGYKFYNYINNYFFISHDSKSDIDEFKYYDVLKTDDGVNFNTIANIKVDNSEVSTGGSFKYMVLSKIGDYYYLGVFGSKDPSNTKSIFYSKDLKNFGRINIPNRSSRYATLTSLFYSDGNTYLVRYIQQNRIFELFKLVEGKAELITDDGTFTNKSRFTDNESYYNYFNNKLYIYNNAFDNLLEFSEEGLIETNIKLNTIVMYDGSLMNRDVIRNKIPDLNISDFFNCGDNTYFLSPVYDCIFRTVDDKYYIYNLKNNSYEEINSIIEGYDIFNYSQEIIYTSYGYYILTASRTSVPESIKDKVYFIPSLSDNNIPPNPNPDSGDDTGNMTPTNPDTEGGDGNFDDTSDNVDRPTLPVVDASAVGMLALYNPTGGELQQFADFLWSPNFYQSIQRFFSDTADAVINLGILPVILPGPMEKKDVSICALRSGVKMNVINNQYVEFSLGKIKIEKYFGSFLDYAPYTNIQIYIPFVGYQTLNTDEVMGNEILLYYHVDLATGNFTCHLQVIRADVFYIANIFTGNMMSKYCISSRSFDQLISAGITAAGTIASAGLGALAATSTTTAATSTATMTAKSASAGSTTALATQGTRAISTNVNIPLNNFTPPEPTDPPVPNVNNVIVKPPVIRTGSLSGSDPLFAPKEAFIIINRPNPAIADKYSSFYGFRANYTETLSNLSGYTKVSAVNLKGFESATLEEKQTIKEQLISGIIL